MNTPLSHIAETLIGSEIVKLGNAIRERKAAGETIYNFTIGDFDPAIFPIPRLLEEYIVEAYRERQTSYPLADGELDLRQAISAFLTEWEGLEYAPNEIQVASGGRPLIHTIFHAVVDPGDNVIYAVPSWNNNHYVHLTRGEHCVIEATVENDFMPTAEQVAPHLHGATLLCLCTPQNPTGTTLKREELRRICELVVQENEHRGDYDKRLYIMFDQMYWTLTFGNTEHTNPVSLVPAVRPYTIFVDGISKCFAATGVRVGWSMGPAPIIAKMKAILSHVGAWAPMAEQKAVARYLKETEDIQQYFASYKAELEHRLAAFANGMIALRNKGYSVDAVPPQAAIYLTVKFDLAGRRKPDGTVLSDQAAVTQYLLEEAKLAIVPFYAFGAPHHSPWYRLSVGTCRKQDIPVVLQHIEQALSALY
jgi:aspartate aminotransferase